MRKLIGLSLSFCVKDLVLAQQPKGELLCIITGTCFLDTHHIGWEEEAYNYYGKRYWKDLPKNEVMKILKTYPIIQPRTKGFSAPSIAKGHWLIVPEMSINQQLDQYNKLYGGTL